MKIPVCLIFSGWPLGVVMPIDNWKYDKKNYVLFEFVKRNKNRRNHLLLPLEVILIFQIFKINFFKSRIHGIQFIATGQSSIEIEIFNFWCVEIFSVAETICFRRWKLRRSSGWLWIGMTFCAMVASHGPWLNSLIGWVVDIQITKFADLPQLR